MSASLALADFYHSIADDQGFFPSLEAYLVDICPRQLQEGSLCFRVYCPGDLDYQALQEAEICLERALSYPHVVLSPQPGPQAKIDWQDQAAKLQNWLRRHALLGGSLEEQLWAHGHLESIDQQKLVWQLPQAYFSILHAQANSWFLDFWQRAGLPGVVASQVAGNSSLNLREKVLEKIQANESEAQACHNPPPPPPPPEATEPPYQFSNYPQASATPYRRRKKSGKPAEGLLYGRTRQDKLPLVELKELSLETDRVRCRGWVQDLESRATKSGNFIQSFILASDHHALRCILYLSEEEATQLGSELRGKYVEVAAQIEWNEQFEHDFQGKVLSIEVLACPLASRQDLAEEKRVELHIHSKLSAKDACSNPADIVAKAAEFGQTAIALTDHGVVQGFPEAFSQLQKLTKEGRSLKLIYGVEGYLVEDGPTVFVGPEAKVEENCRGLVSLAILYDDPTKEPQDREILAYLAYKEPFDPRKQDAYSEGQVGGASRASGQSLLRFLTPMDPAKQNLKQASFPQLANQASVDVRTGLAELAAFLRGNALLTTQGWSDLQSLRYAGFRGEKTDAHLKFNPCFLDMSLLQNLDLPEQGKWLRARPDLAAVRQSFAEGKDYQKAVWGSDQTDILAELQAQLDLFRTYYAATGADSWAAFNESCGHLDQAKLKAARARHYHIIILANNDLGLYHLYRLVSLSHLEYFYKKPRIPRSKLNYFRSGLTLGSACVAGEIFSGVLKAYQEQQGDLEAVTRQLSSPSNLALARFYDYLEIQPLDNNQFLLRREGTGIRSREDLQNLNRLVLAWAEAAGLPVCATCDSHFLDPEDDIYREIIMSDMGFEDEIPAPLYFRTTGEMLEEFAYLGEEKARQVVIENTQAVAKRVEEGMRPFPAGNYPPHIQSSEEELKDLARRNSLDLYGREGQLPQDIAERLDKELSSVISNGYAVMYYIAHKLVKKSNSDGYIVGSRGSVGSSLLATFLGISEVNPLPPHYICPHCHYYEPDASGQYGSGFDLPAKSCPECGSPLNRDGQDIPFATFLGFEGDKQPDIDLNFSGEYQARAHSYLEEMFGEEHTYKAGTTAAYADKQSLALVRKYCEQAGLDLGLNNMKQLAKGIEGVKRSTGQHPGGIVVLPADREVYDFTPIQYPANKQEQGIITTHFDFHALDETILKIDALGHDDPTMLKMLSDLTGVEINDIPIPDERVMELFRSTAAIGIPPAESTIGSATIGLPEVGTIMARDMIQETQPQSFFDLVQLSGLSHGENVWRGNAQDLIREGTCTINEVIGCRDSIMTRLIYAGLASKDAFTIMETVRKGRPLKDEQIQLMRDHQVPEWYIESCRKIKYLFPKAHAAAYSISTQRVAYFKVYYPEAFYCAWFTVRAGDFSRDQHLLPPDVVKEKRRKDRENFYRMANKEDQKSFYILELVEEMQARGINFLPLDLQESSAHKFTSPGPGQIRPPLDIIKGISTPMAQEIVKAREAGGPFQTVEDLATRSGIGPAAVENLRVTGILQGLPESSQLSFFELDPVSPART
ncbi:MAG: PolC-type DNA polymerase III [Eubacteriales bacterium]|nr:PolC-type DNA polymerase III [Eubacteriales bacterium]